MKYNANIIKKAILKEFGWTSTASSNVWKEQRFSNFNIKDFGHKTVIIQKDECLEQKATEVIGDIYNVMRRYLCDLDIIIPIENRKEILEKYKLLR
jgi:hypothetical protein